MTIRADIPRVARLAWRHRIGISASLALVLTGQVTAVACASGSHDHARTGSAWGSPRSSRSGLWGMPLPTVKPSFPTLPSSGLPPSPTAPRVTPAAPGRTQIWVTTPDGTQRLATGRLLTRVPAGTTTIAVQPDDRMQKIDGFGAALTDSSAHLLATLPAAQRDATMHSLFDPRTGAGISIVRVPLGASDFARMAYTYDDMPPGQQDPTLAHFSLAHDDAEIVPLLRQALAINPRLRIIGTPWSAPAWMKTSQSLNGGSLLPTAYDAYGRYLTETVRAYAARGITLSAVTVANEPENGTTDYPSMTLTAAQEAELIGTYVGPAFARAGRTTRILGYDHNWNDPSYPISLLADQQARKYLAGTAFHCYAGEPTAQTQVHDAAPDRGVWFTECSGGSWSPDFGANLSWNARTLLIGALRNWSGSVLLWNLALDPSGGPRLGGCVGCRGVLTIAAGTPPQVTREVEWDLLASAGAAISPDAVRIASPASADGVQSVAVRNADGSRGALLFNTGNSRTVALVDGSRTVVTVVPSGALVAVRWS